MIIACPSCGLQYDVRSFAEGTVVQCRCRAQLTVPAHVVGAVRCPSCGGTVDGTAQRCQYCRSLVTRRRCAQCGAGLREESRFCDQCRAPVGNAGSIFAQASERTCPRCRVPLFLDTCAGQPVEACADCLGMWVSPEVVQRMAAEVPRHLQRVTSTAAIPGRRGPPVSPPAVAAAGATYIPCPSCGQLMNHVNYGGQSGIIVDYCQLHGVWFDANELNQMLEAIARTGGAAPTGPLPAQGATAPATAPGAESPEQIRRRIHAQTLDAIERQQEESLEAIMGDAALEVVDWVRASLRRLIKGRRDT